MNASPDILAHAARTRDKAHKKKERSCLGFDYLRGPLDVRLWRRVQKNGPDECWPWTGQSNGTRNGLRYGCISKGGNRGQTVKVHRVAYELTFGPISAGLCVCHRCDNPICCNPSHLFLGTRTDNMRDMAKKGRAAQNRGANNQNARLTQEQVAVIRATPKGASKELAKLYGVHPAHIRSIRRGRSWKAIDL